MDFFAAAEVGEDYHREGEGAIEEEKKWEAVW